MFQSLAITVGVLICLAVNVCAAADRVLSFPADRERGVVLVGAQPVMSNGWTDFFEQRRKVGDASGNVTVPSDSFVELHVNRLGSKNLAFLNALPADGIHYLVLTGARLREAEFIAIARFTSLRVLILTDCTPHPDLETSRLAIPPALEMLNFSVTNTEGRKTLLEWAARSPQIRYVYDRDRSLDLEALRQFRNNQSIKFLTVDLDNTSWEVIDELATMPNLQGLNAHVKPGAELESLPKLKAVRLINWNDGGIGASLVNTLRQMPSLTGIRFQGNANLLPDFAPALGQWQTLEELGLNCSTDGCPADELQAAFVLMKRLNRLPRIQNPTKLLLKALAEREALERIQFDGLGPDATAADVAKVCRSKSLDSVALTGIPFTTEIGEALCGCTRLSYLSIDVDEFDGHNLPHPEGLSNLEKLSLTTDHSTVNLSYLGRLPRLTELTLSFGALQRVDYTFIAQCKTLRWLNSHENFFDDRSIAEIADSKTLQSLYLGENCVLTDSGVVELLRMGQLRDLAIGGVMSAAAIQKLDQIKGLNTLTVSGMFSETDRDALKKHFVKMSSVTLYDFRSPYGLLLVGDDGIWRITDPKWREKLDELEGKSLRELMGPALTESLEATLHDKVVLIDFWGTWCGPCLSFMPELQRIREANGGRLEVLGIHSEAEADTMDDYLKQHPKPWPNIADKTGELTKAFRVQIYPSLYLIDQEGRLRVAQPHRLGLESSIDKLMR